MYKTILVPIDMAQVEKAPSMIVIAKSQIMEGGQIILLNVIEPIPDWVTASLPEDILSRSRQTAFEELHSIAKTAGIEATIEIKIGQPYKTILQAARETNAELIIVASHKPEIQDYLLGSTAGKVVRHAKCSVLVTR